MTRGAGAIWVRAAGSRPYPVYIENRALHRLARDLTRGRVGTAPRIVVIADRRVARLHGPALLRSIKRRGARCDLLSFPPGEASKTRETKARLEDALVRLGFGRGVVVALGGGVTGDLAGFVAATWHRGIPWIAAPTTVIAMLDASIGGKVGVDHPSAKNLTGAFHAPLAVYADTATLETLSGKEFRSGLAEAVKCGAIGDARLFRSLEHEAEAIRSRRPGAILRAARGSAAFKARIVSVDEREAGPRLLLNFGHTIGHALETVSGYRLRHGEAVAIGLGIEARLAERLGILPAEGAERIEALLERLGLPPRSAVTPISVGAIMAAAGRDKKVREGKIRFALPRAIGHHAGGAAYVVEVPGRELRAVLRSELG